jgi:hypothetical protein
MLEGAGGVLVGLGQEPRNLWTRLLGVRLGVGGEAPWAARQAPAVVADDQLLGVQRQPRAEPAWPSATYASRLVNGERELRLRTI